MHSHRGPRRLLLLATGVLLIAAAVQTGSVTSAQQWLFGTVPTPVSLGVTPSAGTGDAPSQVPGPAVDPASPRAAPSSEGSIGEPSTSPTAGPGASVARGPAISAAKRTTTTSPARRSTTTSSRTTRPATTRPATTPTKTTPTKTTPTKTTSPTVAPTATRSSATKAAAPPSDPGGSSPADEVVRLTNAQRTANGCPALTVDSRLTKAAQAHSEDMRERNFFEHTNPDGKSPFDRVRATGYGYRMAAENIAAGQPTAAAVVNAWMNSEGHRRNILNCSLRQIGVGVASGGSYRIYWTQVFGTP